MDQGNASPGDAKGEVSEAHNEALIAWTAKLGDVKLVSRAACRREAVVTLDTSFAPEHQRPSEQGRSNGRDLMVATGAG